MNITIVVNNRIPVSAYGGTERVVWCLGKEFKKMGHNVTFIAPKGSACNFTQLIEYQTESQISSLIPENSDIVHFNNNVYTTRKPYVVTIHGNVGIGHKVDRNSIFVSKNHAKRHNSDSFVYNGLDWDDYGEVDCNNIRLYFHFLGNASWKVKNVKGAIDVIKLLPEERLYVLGGKRFNFRMGWRFTFHHRTSFKGMVGGDEKLRYLKESKGLIFPTIWHEPFGLAIIESLYCGAPVFATPYGSLPELVTKEVGFLTNSRKEMAEHIDANHYSARGCHEYASDCFNSKIMAEEYLHKYEAVLSGHSLNKNEPIASEPYKNLLWSNDRNSPLYNSEQYVFNED